MEFVKGLQPGGICANIREGQAPYFCEKYRDTGTSAGSEAAMALDFGELLHRLRTWLNHQVHNGALTERGLARRAGLSQSHIHNVLKGVRILTPATADRILKALNLTLLDLLEPGEGERLLGRKLEQDQTGPLTAPPGPQGETVFRIPPSRALPRGRLRAPRMPSSPS